MRYIILGAPNSGKGTQAKLLAKKLGLVYMSTGDFFRKHFETNDAFHDYTKRQFASGLLCSDQNMNAFMKGLFQRGEIPGDNYLLDSYPRTVPQDDGYQEFVQGQFRAIYLDISRDISIERARLRARTLGRLDDLGNAPERRWDVFERETLPLVSGYRRGRILIEQNGIRTINMISRELEEKVRRAV